MSAIFHTRLIEHIIYMQITPLCAASIGLHCISILQFYGALGMVDMTCTYNSTAPFYLIYDDPHISWWFSPS